jgi:hypothetical protein
MVEMEMAPLYELVPKDHCSSAQTLGQAIQAAK